MSISARPVAYPILCRRDCRPPPPLLWPDCGQGEMLLMSDVLGLDTCRQAGARAVTEEHSAREKGEVKGGEKKGVLGEQQSEPVLSEPERKAVSVEKLSEPLKAVGQVKKVVEPVKKLAEPVKKAVEPVKKAAEPVKKIVESVKKAAWPAAEPVKEVEPV